MNKLVSFLDFNSLQFLLTCLCALALTASPSVLMGVKRINKAINFNWFHQFISKLLIWLYHDLYTRAPSKLSLSPIQRKYVLFSGQCFLCNFSLQLYALYVQKSFGLSSIWQNLSSAGVSISLMFMYFTPCRLAGASFKKTFSAPFNSLLRYFVFFCGRRSSVIYCIHALQPIQS